jgi:ATP-dependent Clp protease adaptor protein ClpS
MRRPFLIRRGPLARLAGIGEPAPKLRRPSGAVADRRLDETGGSREPGQKVGARLRKGSSLIAEPHPLLSRFRAGMALIARWFTHAKTPVVGAPLAASAPLVASKEPRRTGDTPGSGAAVITRPRTQSKKPSLYRVLLLNDDYTPMEFVVSVLQAFFNKNQEEAYQIMLHVHHNGVGECGVFTYEIAETKVAQVMDHARKNQHPLQCIMEKK